jgi:hypothetical protein
MGDPPASGPDPTNPTPEAPGPTSSLVPPAAPRPRSWFASLSRRGSSNTPLNELAEPPPPSTPSEQQPAAGAQSVCPSTTAVTTPPVEERSEAVPASLPISENPTIDAARPEPEVKLVPRKRAWFASSSSPKRPSNLRPGDERDDPSPPNDPARADPRVPEMPQPPITNIIPPTPPRLELTRVEDAPPSETVPVPIPAPAARKWFPPASPSQSRSPESEARPASGPQAGMDSPRTPSSIDDQLPSAAPSSESASPPVIYPSQTSQNMSSLNPSASRFSLSIPFLGRPKVPLDRAIASAQATDIRTGPDASPTSSDAVESGEPRLEAIGEYSSSN